MGAFEASANRLGFQGPQDLGACSLATVLGKHGHSPELHRARVECVKATGADCLHAVVGERVNGRRIGAVVLVKLLVKRNTLLLHEHATANR